MTAHDATTTDERPAQLRCALGHTYPGHVRVVEYQRYDMDGEPLPPPRSRLVFDPDHCITCGLITWSAES